MEPLTRLGEAGMRASGTTERARPVQGIVRAAGIAAMLLAVAGPVGAQSQADQAKILKEAQEAYDQHNAEFDFLLGDWEFVQTRPSPSGPVQFKGFWSAVRSRDGALITDEFRIVDDKGGTSYVSTTMRAYNPFEKQWNLIGVEPTAGLMQPGTAWREGNDMRVDQVFGAGPNQSHWRIRYHNIRPDAFSWKADRSTDGGKTWTENYRTIEAKRIGPARAPGALTPPASRAR
jgi:hypothetical protein